MSNCDDWNDVEAHIERREGGCWTWDGSPVACNVYRLVAEAYGAPLPTGRKLYRMPGCKLGKDCVNPNHIGTGEDYMLALDGQRRRWSEPQKNVTEIRLSKQDREFLKALRIRWE